MPRGSAQLTQARRDEIIAACAKLYETMSFKDITLKEIARETSFTRPSIYNYFTTKEEIFLALLQREYELWVQDLRALRDRAEGLSVESFADALAATLESRRRLLKIMTTNIHDMEANSRPENLAEMKAAFGDSLRAVDECLSACMPAMSAARRESFVYAFFPFVYGLYAYTEVSEKQRAAMESAGVPFRYHGVRELAGSCVRILLSGL